MPNPTLEKLTDGATEAMIPELVKATFGRWAKRDDIVAFRRGAG